MRRTVRVVKQKNVQRVRGRNGKTYKFHRLTRAPLPSDIPEDDPAFLRAWLAEEDKTGRKRPPPPAKEGTIEAGCIAYLASQSFAALSNSYRPLIRRHVDAIRKTGGAGQMRDLLPRHIEADLEQLTPAVASHRRKAWRKLGPFWKIQGWIPDDITAAAKGKPRQRVDGHLPWDDADVAAFRARWPVGSQQRLAMEIMAWTGARCVDAVRLGPGMVRGGLLRFRQQKTGGEAIVPWPCPEIEESLIGGGMVFLVTAYGHPRSQKGLSQWFAAAAREAGLVRKTAHGLRKYRMNKLAEEGASVLKMQAWVGHVTLDEVEHYIRKAQRAEAVLGPERERISVKRPAQL